MRSPAVAALMLVLVLPASAVELVENGDFGRGFDPWWTDGPISAVAVDGGICVDVPGGTANIWDLAIGQDGLSLVAGTEYAFRFRASGTPGGTIRAILQLPQDPWTEYVELAAEVSPEPQEHAVKFTSTVTMDDAQLAFQIGGSPTPWTVCIDDVSVDDDPAAAVAAIGPPSQGDANPQDTGPRVRINQLGFLPDGPKHATIVTDATAPLPFVVKNEIGADVFSGMTEPRGFDQSAGLNVHVADFSDFRSAGENFTVAADLEASFPFDIDADLYDRLRIDALSYFYPARSGTEVLEAIAGAGYGRPAGHLGRPGGPGNQGDFGVPCQTAAASEAIYGEAWTCDYTLDVTQGWYDAGDYGKYVVNGAVAAGYLMAAYERAATMAESTAPAAEGIAALGDGSLPIPERGNGISDLMDEVVWELQFLLEMTVPDGEPLAGMLHHKVHGSTWGDFPEMPHEDDTIRELHRPSTAATLDAAAAFAMAARLEESARTSFGSVALAAAERAWQAAVANPALHAPNADGEGGGSYADDDVTDEVFWAAAELFITTGKPEYLAALRDSRWWTGEPFIPEGGDWKFVAPFATLALARHADLLPAADGTRIVQAVIDGAEAHLATQATQPFGLPYLPQSGRYDWGSNQSVIQVALVLATAYDLTGETRFRDGAIEAMDYILGRNALNQSYVTGYGRKYSQNQHLAWMAWSIDPALPRPLPGTLAGGPNSSTGDEVSAAYFAERGCAPQACYIDDVYAWSVNESAINWQAALAQYAAWLADQ